MTTGGQGTTGRAGLGWKLGIPIAVYAAGLAGFGVAVSRHCTGHGLMAALVFFECAAAAAALAVCVGWLDQTGRGVLRFAGAAFVVALALAAVSVPILCCAAWAWGAAPLGGALVAQFVVISFCLLIGSMFAVIRAAGGELLFAQFVTMLAACAVIGTVFYADPIVEAPISSGARSTVITAVLAASPITAISWSLLEFDLMRQQVMYDRVSVIGRWYQTPYPDWWKTMCGYLVLSAVMFGGAAWLRRRRAKAGGTGR